MALGLVVAVAMPAAAVELRLSGSWYMTGFYVDNPSGLDKNSTRANDPSWGTYTYNPARNAGETPANLVGAAGQTAGDARHNRGAVAYYVHKLQFLPEIKVTEGLSLKTSISMLQGVMGDNTQKQTNGGGLVTPTTTTRQQSGATAAGNSVFIQENLEWNYAYVDFKTALGRFEVGYVSRGLGFGTAFLNDPYPWGGVQYSNVMGPMTLMGSAFKYREYANRNNYGVGQLTNGVWNDADGDQYNLAGIYKMKIGEAGLNIQYIRDSRAKQHWATGAPDSTGLRPTNNQGWISQLTMFQPYAKLRFGIVYLESELFYQLGNMRKYETFAAGTTTEPDVTVNAYGGYIKGQVDLKPFFAGAMFVYMSGDDLQNKDKITGSMGQWQGWNYTNAVHQTLILWNSEMTDHMGNTIVGNNPATNVNPRTGSSYRGTRYMDNVWFYQIYGGMNITPKMNVTGRLSYATADKKPKMGIGEVGTVLNASTTSAAYLGQANREFVSDKYGTELDLVATYKIYDNLSYTVGAGYLWVGDYFKGYDNDAKLKDNYIVTHKLSLFF
jgi:hypothetical protein